MTRSNIESINNAPWVGGGVNAWLLPYARTGKAGDALAAHYEAQRRVDPATFGHAFWTHFHQNNYTFSRKPSATDERFCVPHDSVHVLTSF